ncbi:hypothetical protein [Ammoniphilus sp. 3BR4]|uniref:hypothetical protein n=1 Tax=Ammoniphilus sp. 3BR4 TaxID=3158265 RepID=UPI003465501C
MDMQQAIEVLKNRVQQLEPTIHNESERNRLQFTVSFWSLLEAVNDSTPYTHLLPISDHSDRFFDAVLLSPGGVYLYYLLPYELTYLSVLPDRLVCNALGKETELVFGDGRKMIRKIQRDRELAALPVYECYVVPEGGKNVRYVLEDTLILSFEHYPRLFESFAFREHTAHQESQLKLFGYLSEMVSNSPDGEWEALEGPPALGTLEPQGTSKGDFIAILENTSSKLPPRQRRRKQKEGSWLQRLITRNK